MIRGKNLFLISGELIKNIIAYLIHRIKKKAAYLLYRLTRSNTCLIRTRRFISQNPSDISIYLPRIFWRFLLPTNPTCISVRISHVFFCLFFFLLFWFCLLLNCCSGICQFNSHLLLSRAITIDLWVSLYLSQICLLTLFPILIRLYTLESDDTSLFW